MECCNKIYSLLDNPKNVRLSPGDDGQRKCHVARGNRFMPQLRQHCKIHFIESIPSPAQRDGLVSFDIVGIYCDLTL